jgi:tetratricopeptide (TPR) repeat protein
MTKAPLFTYDVFLSHNRAQKDWTEKLARHLDEKAIKPWFDKWCLPAGTVASLGMERGIKESRHVLLVLSPEFLSSEWTEYETQIATVISPSNRDRKLVPILYANCDVPERFSRISWIDFRDTHGDEERYAYCLAQLLADLRADLYERPKDFERFQQQRRQQQNQDPEQIPPVRPLPPGSRMSRAPIGNFVGREKELRELARRLTPGSGSLVGVHAAVTGLGGVGKSQLAIEFAHRYGQRYPGGVFWLNMESADNGINEIAACGGPEGMNLPGFADLNTPEQATLVQKHWQEDPAARLLLFDNAEEPELVEKWRPKTGRCAVLITSRRNYWPVRMGIQPVPIETLPRPSSMELLRKSRPGLSHDAVESRAADELCKYLGDLPLALQVAAAYLEQYPSERIQDYLRDLLQVSKEEQPLNEVWSCFAISYRKLNPEQESDALAMRLFQLAGYFAPASIARHLLAQAAELGPTEDESRKLLNSALARLQELALIAEEPDGRLLLHRLLREFARQQQIPVSEEAAALRVAEVLLRFANTENASGLPQELSKERIHLRQAAMEAERSKSELAGDLYNELGQHGHTLALLQEAKADSERALKIYEDAHGTDHPTVAVVANNIGLILKDQGDLAGALECSRRALKIDEQVYGPDHPKAARNANNIGLILKAQGDLAGALDYSQRALKIDEQIYGPDHPNVATRANNIGLILKEQGDLAGALDYSQRALKIGEQVYGPDHPRVAICANNIGLILKEQGDLAGALKYVRRALKIDEQVYGPDHPNVARDSNNIGHILKNQGDLAGALEYIRRALKIDEQVYGPDHPSVAIRANNIGMTLQDQGNLEGALEYIRRALAISEKVYGPDNPTTKTIAANLCGLEELMDEKKQL